MGSVVAGGLSAPLIVQDKKDTRAAGALVENGWRGGAGDSVENRRRFSCICERRRHHTARCGKAGGRLANHPRSSHTVCRKEDY